MRSQIERIKRLAFDLKKYRMAAKLDFEQKNMLDSISKVEVFMKLDFRLNETQFEIYSKKTTLKNSQSYVIND